MNWQAIGTIVAVVATVGTLVSVWLQIRKSQPNVKLDILYSQSLNIVPSLDDDIEVTFVYKNGRVVNPWRVGFQIENAGDAPIIGKGGSKNIVNDGLYFSVDNDFQILKIVSERCNFQPAPTAKMVSLTTFILEFQQWRPGESCFFSLYLTGVSKRLKDPGINTIDRDLLVGDVVIHNYSKAEESRAVKAIEKLPSVLKNLLTIFAYITCVILGGVGLVVPFQAWADFIRYKYWRHNHLGSFVQHIEKLGINEELRNRLKTKPELTPSEIWTSYSGKRIPSSNLLFTSIRGGIVSSILFLFLSASLIGALLHMITV